MKPGAPVTPAVAKPVTPSAASSGTTQSSGGASARLAVQGAKAAEPKMAQGGGTQTGMVAASHIGGAAKSGVMRSGVKPLTSTSIDRKPMPLPKQASLGQERRMNKTASPAWTEAVELAKRGLIRPEALRKIAAVRAGIMANKANMQKQAGIFDNLTRENIAEKWDSLMGGGSSPAIEINQAKFTEAAHQANKAPLIDAIIAQHADKLDNLIPYSDEAVPAVAQMAQAERGLVADRAALAYTRRAGYLGSKTFDELRGLVRSLQPVAPKTPSRAWIVAAPLAVAGAGIVGSKMQEMWEKRKRDKDMQGELTKVLPELSQEDPRKVRDAYDIVKHIAPSVASNPQASAYVVKQLVNLGNVADVQTVQLLAKAESDMGKGGKDNDGLFSKMMKNVVRFEAPGMEA